MDKIRFLSKVRLGKVKLGIRRFGHMRVWFKRPQIAESFKRFKFKGLKNSHGCFRYLIKYIALNITW